MSEWNIAPGKGQDDTLRRRPRDGLARFLTPRPGQDPTLLPIAFAVAACLLEVLVITALGFAIAAAYVGDRPEILAEYFLPVPLLALTTVSLFRSMQLYEPAVLRRFSGALGRIAGLWTIVFLLAFTLIFFLKLEGVFSRVIFASWYCAGLIGLLCTRLMIARIGASLAGRGLFRRRAILVGGGPEADAFLAALRTVDDHDLDILGIVDDRAGERSPERVGDVPKLGDVASIASIVRSNPVDLAIFTLPVSAEGRILKMLGALNVLPIDIRLAAHAQKLRFRPRNYETLGGLPAFAIVDRPVSGWSNFQKAAFDRIVGGLILLALLPVMAMIALLVRLDSPGPALFRQKRFGFNNEPIEVFKFRSMYVDQSDFDASKLATRDDPRITRLGRFLRRSSLDELPQLFNVVLFGNLSLVGPRPHAFKAKAGDRLYEEVIDGYFARHRVKPGMTGWAQINGWRGETDTPEKLQKRVEHDLHYIENWSLMLDLSILLITPVALVRGENAY